MKVLSLQKLSSDDEELLKKAGTVEYLYVPASEITEDTLDSVDVILGYDNKITDLLTSNDSVKWVQAWSAGVDQLPQQLFKEKHISLTNASGAMVPGLAEQILGEMITWNRHLQHAFISQQKHTWNELQTSRYQELADKTLLLLGVGHIGQQVAKLAAAFGMRIIGVRHSSKPAPNVDQIYSMDQMMDIVAQADFVLNTLPVTTQTKDVINEKFFAQMKKSAVYINYGRGKTNNEDDLVKALQNGQIAGAIMDVFKEEPLPSSSTFWQLGNVLLTPHTGGDTALYDHRVVEIAARNIRHMAADEIVPVENVVDLGQGY